MPSCHCKLVLFHTARFAAPGFETVCVIAMDVLAPKLLVAPYTAVMECGEPPTLRADVLKVAIEIAGPLADKFPTPSVVMPSLKVTVPVGAPAVLGVAAADVDRVIDAVDLRSHADDRVDRLSGGQQSRASLAAALLGDPELLVLDEPTVGLDPVLRRDLWNLFHSLADAGATLLVSSHVMDEASRCDRLLLMRDGDLLADDPPQTLLDSVGTTDMEQAFLTLIERKAGAR